jgi:hypothetical protein
MTPSRWAFGLCILFALATVVLTLAFGTPPEPAVPLHGGFETPILALEFATRVEHLDFLQGEAGAEMRDYIRRVQLIDVFFPIAYAGMAACLFLGMALRGNFLAILGVGLAVATIVADWQENATIDDILDEIENPHCNEETLPEGREAEAVLRDCLPEEAFQDTSPALDLASFVFDSFLPIRIEFLREDTWTKWALMATYAVLLSALLWFSGRPRWYEWRRWLAVPPALAAFSICLTWLFRSNGHVAEIMGLLLIPFMLTFPVAAVMYFLAKPKGHRKAEAPRR